MVGVVVFVILGLLAYYQTCVCISVLTVWLKMEAKFQLTFLSFLIPSPLNDVMILYGEFP